MPLRLLAGFLLGLVLLAPTGARERSLVLVQWSDLRFGSDFFRAGARERAWREGMRRDPDVVVLWGDPADNKGSPEEFARRSRGFLECYGRRPARRGRPLVLALGNNDFARNDPTDPEVLEPPLTAWRKALGDAPRCFPPPTAIQGPPSRPGRPWNGWSARWQRYRRTRRWCWCAPPPHPGLLRWDARLATPGSGPPGGGPAAAPAPPGDPGGPLPPQ